MTHICSRRSTNDVMQIIFKFHFWSCEHLHMVVLHLITKFCANMFIQYGDLAFYKIQYGHHLPSWICREKSWEHTSRPFHNGYVILYKISFKSHPPTVTWSAACITHGSDPSTQLTEIQLSVSSPMVSDRG